MLNEVHTIIKMIDLVKIRPGIYNHTMDEHNNRTYVECLWNEVAMEMGCGITASDCRRKWASLRNALSRDYRNEKEAKLNQRKKKKWYLADHLSFLRNNLYHRNKKQKGSSSTQDSDEEENNCTTQEDKTLIDFSTQVVLNEYLSSEETNEMDNKPSLASFSSDGVLNETKPLYVVIAPPLLPPPPLRSLSLPSAKTVPSTPILSSGPTGSSEQQVLAAPPSSSHEIEHHNLMESSFTKKRRSPDEKNIIENRKKSRSADEKNMLDNRNMTFFRSIIPDLLTLSERRQRLYKQNVLLKLNRLLDELEKEI